MQIRQYHKLHVGPALLQLFGEREESGEDVPAFFFMPGI
jgi:hypothetical protein